MSISETVTLINSKNDREEYDSALKTALEALKKQKGNYSLWIAAGNAYYGLKDFEHAEQAYKQASVLNQKDVVSLSNLAGVYFETKHYEQGLNVCQQALQRDSDYTNIYIHQGNMLSCLNRYDEAISAYQKALEKVPDDPLVLYNMAYACSMTPQTKKTKSYYERLLSQCPDDPEYLFAYASFLEKTEQLDEAAQTYLALLAVKEEPSTHIMLSGCLYNMLLLHQNERVYQLTDQWLERFPDNPVACHMLKTLKGNEVKRASADYVKELFDAFAESFDSVLEGLSYQAPYLVAQAVENIAFASLPSILDLGCGTGLCAQALKEKNISFSTMVGVDLSPQMLEKAAGRKLYTSLEENDFLSFLPLHSDQFDLIISADAFTYLGDLSELFKGMQNALKKKGKAVFTVSLNQDDPDHYALEPSGRFMHGEKYIKNELKNNSLHLESVSFVELRQELGNPVYGLLAICEKI